MIVVYNNGVCRSYVAVNYMQNHAVWMPASDAHLVQEYSFVSLESTDEGVQILIRNSFLYSVDWVKLALSVIQSLLAVEVKILVCPL